MYTLKSARTSNTPDTFTVLTKPFKFTFAVVLKVGEVCSCTLNSFKLDVLVSSDVLPRRNDLH